MVFTFTRNMSDKPKVYVTRRVPSRGIDLLKKHCTITQWDTDDAISRETLKKNVAGVDALFCLLTEKIDGEILDAAGMNKKSAAVLFVNILLMVG